MKTEIGVENTDRRKDGEDNIIRRIKINPPTFNGILNLKIFSDWITDLITTLVDIGSQRRIEFDLLG